MFRMVEMSHFLLLMNELEGYIGGREPGVEAVT